jgi:hypothetical protein
VLKFDHRNRYRLREFDSDAGKTRQPEEIRKPDKIIGRGKNECTASSLRASFSLLRQVISSFRKFFPCHSAYEKVSQEKTVFYWQKNVFFCSRPPTLPQSIDLYFFSLTVLLYLQYSVSAYLSSLSLLGRREWAMINSGIKGRLIGKKKYHQFRNQMSYGMT